MFCNLNYQIFLYEIKSFQTWWIIFDSISMQTAFSLLSKHENEEGHEAYTNELDATSTAEAFKNDFQKHCEVYEARKSPICAVCHTYCIFYSINYRDFKNVTLIDPKLYKLFKTIALERKKQEAGYSDTELCKRCLESVNDDCEVLCSPSRAEKNVF